MGASESKPEIKIILVGKTGVGKSSTGNTILKKHIFPSESSPISKTKDSATGNGMVNNRRITVFDTPGIFDTSDDEKNIKEKLIRVLVDCAPGPFVLVIVKKVERHTEQEREIETKIWEYFKAVNSKQSLVLFTHGEELEGQTIEEFVKKSARLQEFVDKFEGRCHVIDSKYWKNYGRGYKSNRFQVKNLLDTIDKMRKENECYTNELLQILDEEIKKEMEFTDLKLSQQERRERAKMNVFNKLLIRFAGVATGTLVGAVMGIAIPVAALVAIVKGVKNVSATLTKDSDEATAGETRLTAAAVFGAAAVGTSASVSAFAAVEAIVAAGAAGATASASIGAAAAVGAAGAGATVAVGAASAGAAAGATAVVGAASASAAAAGATVAVGAASAGTAAGATAAVGAALAGAAAGATASVGAAAGATVAVGAASAGVAATVAVGAASAGATAVVGATSVGTTAAVGAASAGAAAVGAAAVEAGVAAGAAAGGAVAVEAGVAAGAGIGAAAGSGIAVGVVFGVAALAGAIGGGITGYKAVDNADSVLDAIKIAAKANYENVKEVVKKAEELPTKVHKKLGRRIQEGSSLEILLSEENDK